MKVGDHVIRKTRIDKKKEVQPTLSIDLKDAIYRLGYVTHTNVKDLCEYLCHTLLIERKTFNDLSKYFQRGLIFEGSIIRGHLDNEQIEKRFNGRTGKVTIKFKRADYEAICSLGYALNVTPSRTVAILLDLAMNDPDIVDQYIKDYLTSEVTSSQMMELKYLLEYVNGSNEDQLTWTDFFKQIHEEKGSPMIDMKEIVNEYLNDKNY